VTASAARVLLGGRIYRYGEDWFMTSQRVQAAPQWSPLLDG
tara:strand:- start:1827 stop:1949 length:123 start_codon:yes stop_codon:yes gene_type:complete